MSHVEMKKITFYFQSGLAIQFIDAIPHPAQANIKFPTLSRDKIRSSAPRGMLKFQVDSLW